jgi:hypothetical protein
MNLHASLAALFVSVALLTFCGWRESRPIEIGKPRHIPYVPLMIFCMAVILFVSAHIVSLLLGKPLPSQNLGF